MKFLVIAVLIAFVSAQKDCPTKPTSRPGSKAIDYVEVKLQVGILHNVVTINLEAIKTTAVNDNQEIGTQIVEKVDRVAAQALATLAEAEIKIDGETLTLNEAKNYLTSLEALLLSTQSDLQPLLTQLSLNVQGIIRGIFEGAYTEAQQIANIIYCNLTP